MTVSVYLFTALLFDKPIVDAAPPTSEVTLYPLQPVSPKAEFPNIVFHSAVSTLGDIASASASHPFR